jgi:hypothetical protein
LCAYFNSWESQVQWFAGQKWGGRLTSVTEHLLLRPDVA